MSRIVFACFLFLTGQSWAQDTVKRFPDFKVVPNLTSYSSYQSSLTSDSTFFNQDKLMFGFTAFLNKNWSTSLGIDMVNLDTKNSRKLNAYFKPAKITYQHKNLIIDLGIFILNQYESQTQFWENRYISKVFQDKYGMGNISDLGIHVTYKWSSMLSTDVTLTTGKGHKLLDCRAPYKPSFRVIFNPWKTLTLVGYYDFYGSQTRQQAYSFAANIRNTKKNSITVEYNSKSNMRFISGLNYRGISTYGNYHINNWLGVFLRYDWLQTILPNSTMMDTGGSSVISGIDAHIFKYARFSVNYQNWRPNYSMNQRLDWLFLNLEIKY